MNNAQMLIERLRKKLPTKSNYAIAKALEMAPSSVADVLAGKYGLGSKAVIRLHELLGMDTRDLLVLIEEDKAKTPSDKDFWGRRSPRITASGALAALAFGLALTTSQNANAHCIEHQLQADSLYIMRSMLLWSGVRLEWTLVAPGEPHGCGFPGILPEHEQLAPRPTGSRDLDLFSLNVGPFSNKATFSSPGRLRHRAATLNKGLMRLRA